MLNRGDLFFGDLGVTCDTTARFGTGWRHNDAGEGVAADDNPGLARCVTYSNVGYYETCSRDGIPGAEGSEVDFVE
jgi:hypothetical protein